MKCNKCGFENKDKAKFCTKCGNPLSAPDGGTEVKDSSRSKYVIVGLVAVIIILVATVGWFMLSQDNSNSIQNNASDVNASSAGDSKAVDSKQDSDSEKTTSVSSQTEESDSKEWVSIGSYSGSGSGSKTISVPEGKIMVKFSAYPIKNYATNHLRVSGSNGESGEVDWGSKSAVETRSDSFTYTSSSEEVFTIDYYETVSWNVEFFRYQ